MPGDTLIVGLGSAHGDDRVGWRVAEAFDSRGMADVIARRAASPIDLLDWLDGIRRLAICDACQGPGPAGRWHRWTWPAAEICRLHASGSHDLGLPAVLELAARLGRLPSEVHVWGIEIIGCEANADLTDEVARAVPDVVQDVVSVLLVKRPQCVSN